MQPQQMENYKKWFDKYVAGFYGSDDYVNANLRLKEEHSKRVCDEMRYITSSLHLPDSDTLLAETIALFHDIGRFEQFKRFKTYKDDVSIDHAKLAIEVLRKEKVLDSLGASEKDLIERAIELHNIMQLPAGLDEKELLHARLIRDADKLDVFRIVLWYYKKYEDDPAGFNLEIELPESSGYSKDVLDKVLKGQRIDYRQLKTWNDMKLCQLSWVYDVNFAPTFERIRQEGFLERIVSFLPQTDEIKQAAKAVLEFCTKAC